uniref:Reticulon-like protein n=2 Tax=Aegilops tauschii subsp. strangulata TaxID=200361 RepID=A0A453DV22_AEGTS
KYIFAEQDCTPKYQTKDLSQSYSLLSPLKVAKVSKPMHIQVIRITTSMASCIPKTSNQHQTWQREDRILTDTGRRGCLAGKGPSMPPSVDAKVTSKLHPCTGLLKSIHPLILNGCVHRVAAADIILWRRPKVSASILGAATAAWALFEVAEYHFLTLACYAAMIAMLTFFIWTNASAFMNLYRTTTHFFILTSTVLFLNLCFGAVLLRPPFQPH